MSAILEKLLAIQSELHAPKNQKNTFGGYNYRSCEDILEAAKPICKAHGLLLNLSDDIALIGERYYVKATATIRDAESDESLTVTAFARESADKKGMDDSQITGTASSYARKYALNGLFCVDDTKDADTDEYAKQGKKPPEEDEHERPPHPKPEKAPASFVCQNCGNKIQPYKDANGKDVPVRAIATRSQSKFGQMLCMDCITDLYPESLNK